MISKILLLPTIATAILVIFPETKLQAQYQSINSREIFELKNQLNSARYKLEGALGEINTLEWKIKNIENNQRFVNQPTGNAAQQIPSTIDNRQYFNKSDAPNPAVARNKTPQNPDSSRSSLIGGDYWTFGYSRVSQDTLDYQSNLLTFGGLYPMNSNLSGFGNFYIGKGSYNNRNSLLNYFEDSLLEYGFGGGALYYFDINLGNGIIRSIKPYVSGDFSYEYSIGKALSSWENGNWGFYPGWAFVFGADVGVELLLGNSFSLAASFRFQDLEPSTVFGLDAAYFISEKIGLNFGLNFGDGFSRYDSAFLISF